MAEKTEKATPKKKQDERKKGNIFQSKDVVSSLVLIALLLVLRIAVPYIYAEIKKTIIHYINQINTIKSMDVETANVVLRDFVVKTILCSAPILLTPVITGVAFAGIQTRFRLYPALLKPKSSRLNFFSGIKRMFALRSIVELIKSMAKFVVIALVVYIEISSQTDMILQLNNLDVLNAVVFLSKSISSVLLSVGLASLGIGVIDYLYQWWEYERNMRMSKQEIKEEFKQLEGNPEIKGKIREKQRKMAFLRMVDRVSQADVLITNPTHYAVAIKYDQDKNEAPVVIAKGQDLLALRMIEEAKKHNIERSENPPLARGLYSAVEVDQQIPEEFYVAVAEVLAYVYSLKKKERYSK